ncbi:hypothetical protein [Nitrospirillum sp. BR 11828]|uniref:hypothetical protein n=1 Tax=Nitrospirillum sp. BR 11828 TaxID=3104325 RepID=UPI002ACA2DBD|nr:hypothetical protein [Nitrospirillum sp. BR 11828]MDZ5649734.1 hypothetical protein [Nitrospirillum sp. BR 11828]
MMDDLTLSKRDILGTAAALLAGLALTGGAKAADQPAADAHRNGVPLDFPGTGPIPWIKRIFHLYTGPDGLTRAEQLATQPPDGAQIAQLLRRTAERVSIGGASAGAGFDFHVANQPTLLIPLFGSMVIELHDGTRHELRHGDLAYAEDCTGKGHISRSGPEGSLMVSVQLPKAGCPAVGGSDISKLWRD